MKLSECIENFLNSLTAIQSEYNTQVENEYQCEREIQDLLHYIEIEDISDEYKVESISLLKDCRTTRRCAKDYVKCSQPIIDWISNNDKEINSIKQLLGQVRKEEKYVTNRTYYCRTDILKQLGASEELCSRCNENETEDK